MVYLCYFVLIVPVASYAMAHKYIPDQYFFLLILPLISMAWDHPRKYYLAVFLELVAMGLFIRVTRALDVKNTILIFSGAIPTILLAAELAHYFGQRQREAKRALSASETRYKNLVDCLEDVVWSTDSKGRFTFLSSAVEPLSGYRPDELLGVPADKLLTEESQRRSRAAMASAPPDGRFQVELIHRRRDGAEICVEVRALLSWDAHGRIQGAQGISRDITERKQAEEELRRSEETATAVLNATSDAAFLCDLEANIVRLNKRFAERFNTTVDELLGQNVLQLLPPKNAELRRRFGEQLIATGEPVTFEDEREGKWLEIQLYPVRGQNGALQNIAVFARDITQERAANEALRNSEERYHRITDSITDYIYTVFLEDGVPWRTVHGPACEAVTGYTAEEFDANPLLWIAMVPEEDRPKVEVQARDIIECNRGQPVEHRIRRKDGEMRWVLNTPVLQYDAAGQASGWDGLIQDITERKVAEMALARRDAILRAVNFAADAFLRSRNWNAETPELLARIASATGVNRVFIFENVETGEGGRMGATCRFEWAEQGVAPFAEDAESRRFEYGAQHFGRWAEAFQNRGIIQGNVCDFPHEERSLLSPAGILSLLAVPVFVQDTWWGFMGFAVCREAREWLPAEIDALKTAAGTLGAAIERNRAEDVHRRMATAVEQAAESIIITDPHGLIEYVNPAFERLTGYSAAEVRGKTPWILESGRHEPLFFEDMWRTILRGEVWFGHVVNRCKDGGFIEEEYTISPLRNEHGEIVNFVGLGRDVTSEMNLERQLRQAHKMEALGTLAGGIAHDFKNILAIILGHCEVMLKDLDEGSRLRTSVQTIQRSGQRATELVRQILTYSRQQELELKPLPICAVADEALPLIRASTPATITFREHVDPECGLVMGDHTQIQQVFLNLCTNALQAMRERGGELTLTLAPCDITSGFMSDVGKPVEGPYVCLSVRDTGEGIPASRVQRIFDPFYTTRNVGEGTGLGLSTVHGIVLGCNGMVRVESEVGMGTTFEVYFPRLDVQMPSASEGAPAVTRGTERIMLVDDDGEVVDIFGMVLEDLGYQVLPYVDSREALEAFQADPDLCDLVITDQVMPAMKGIDLARAILDLRPGIPVFLVTGFSEDITPQSARENGIAECFEKPVSTEVLTRAIRNALNGVPGGEAKD